MAKQIQEVKREQKKASLKRALSEIGRDGNAGSFELVEEGVYIIKVTNFSKELDANAVRFELTLEDGRIHYEYFFIWNDDGTTQKKYVNQLYTFLDAALQRTVEDNLSEDLFQKCVGKYVMVNIYHHTGKSGRTFERIDYNFIRPAESYHDLDDLATGDDPNSYRDSEEDDDFFNED